MNHCHAKADRIITGQEYFKKSAAQIHSNIKAQTITESEDRCLHFLEETSLSQRLHAADIVKVRGDDYYQEKYEVGADGFCKFGHFELFLPQTLFSVEATYQTPSYVHTHGVKTYVRISYIPWQNTKATFRNLCD